MQTKTNICCIEARVNNWVFPRPSLFFNSHLLLFNSSSSFLPSHWLFPDHWAVATGSTVRTVGSMYRIHNYSYHYLLYWNHWIAVWNLLQGKKLRWGYTNSSPLSLYCFFPPQFHSLFLLPFPSPHLSFPWVIYWMMIPSFSLRVSACFGHPANGTRFNWCQ